MEPSGDSFWFRDGQPPLVVAKEIAEGDAPLLRQKYPLAYPDFGDVLLLAVADVEWPLGPSRLVDWSDSPNSLCKPLRARY
jgi:hypothetical protein